MFYVPSATVFEPTKHRRGPWALDVLPDARLVPFVVNRARCVLRRAQRASAHRELMADYRATLVGSTTSDSVRYGSLGSIDERDESAVGVAFTVRYEQSSQADHRQENRQRATSKPAPDWCEPADRMHGGQHNKARLGDYTVWRIKRTNGNGTVASYGDNAFVIVTDRERLGSYSPYGEHVTGRAMATNKTRKRAGRKPSCVCGKCSKCKARERKRLSRERNAQLANEREDAKRRNTTAVATSSNGWLDDQRN